MQHFTKTHTELMDTSVFIVTKHMRHITFFTSSSKLDWCISPRYHRSRDFSSILLCIFFLTYLFLSLRNWMLTGSPLIYAKVEEKANDCPPLLREVGSIIFLRKKGISPYSMFGMLKCLFCVSQFSLIISFVAVVSNNIEINGVFRSIDMSQHNVEMITPDRIIG